MPKCGDQQQVSDEDFKVFVKPYMSKDRLMKIFAKNKKIK